LQANGFAAEHLGITWNSYFSAATRVVRTSLIETRLFQRVGLGIAYPVKNANPLLYLADSTVSGHFDPL